jgi:Holliday junction resolvasome RuvABC endonuclease subunit
MSARWVGVTVSGGEVVAVDFVVPATGPLEVVAEVPIKLDQNEDRATALENVYRRVRQYVHEHEIKKVVLKASATMQQPAKLVLLHSAEVRGVVAAAAASGGVRVLFLAKARLSKSFGNRKVDEYLKDNGFWSAEVKGDLKRGSREAAFMVLAEARPRDAAD